MGSCSSLPFTELVLSVVVLTAAEYFKLDVDRGPPKEVRLNPVIGLNKTCQKASSPETQKKKAKLCLVAQRLLFCDHLITIAHAIKNNLQP